MPTTIRLKRVGRNKQATFRIVVTDSATGPAGPSIERLGLYNPRTRPSLLRLDAVRTLHWLREGAQPSDSVRSLLRTAGVWEQWTRGVAPEEVEERFVVLGPPPGEQKTSQRPTPEPTTGKIQVDRVTITSKTRAARQAEEAAARAGEDEAEAADSGAETAEESVSQVEAEEAPAAEAEAEEATQPEEPEAVTEAEAAPADEAEAEEGPAGEAEAAEAPAAESGTEEGPAEPEAEAEAPVAEEEEESEAVTEAEAEAEEGSAGEAEAEEAPVAEGEKAE
ncbi:MAG: 30S ribosomal protein S16, partial [Gemmatimonadota bacterium]